MGMVTIVFTDLVGSTELTGRLGDDRANALRRGHFDQLGGITERRGGRVVKNQGDGLMLAFDSAVDAVTAAIDMQRAVELAGRGAEQLSMRIGLHVGEPEEAAGDYFGIAVNVASRLCGAATGGQIIASDLVRAIVGSRGGFSFAPLGALDLKGVDDPVPASQVGWEPAPRIVSLPTALQAPDATRLVGRAIELESLRNALSRATEGSFQLALVAGEPGIGKTRLVLELARQAHAEGSTVLYGRCDEELPAPYRPFTEALRHLAAQGTEIGGASRLSGDPADEPSSDPEVDRLRLFDAVAATLRGAGQPVMLVLDDLHWADRPTLLLLRHLAREHQDAALLLVGTYRDVEVDRTHPLAEILAELRRDLKHERILLRGLTSADVQSYLAERAGHELDAAGMALAEAIHRETEGNPFFVREILRHLVETGAIYQHDGRWTADTAVDEVGLPESIRDVIGRRLTRLGQEASAALQVASVIGREFDLRLLAQLTDRSEDELADIMDGAVAVGGVVSEAPGALDRFSFSHALVRETLYEELTTSRRLRLHRRAAESLEAMHADDPDPVLDEIARHYAEAAATGVADKAVEFARLAAARAMRLLAFEDAAAHLGRALETLDVLDEHDGDLATALLLDKAEAHRLAVEVAQSRRDARRAFSLAREANDAERMVQAILTHGGLWVDIGVVNEQLLEMIEQALDALPDDHPSLPKLLGRKAMEHFMGDPEQLEEASERSLELARAQGDPATIGYALVARRHAVSGPDRLSDRLALTEETIEIARRLGDLEMEVRARSFLLGDLLEAGRGDDLDAATDEFVALTGEHGHPLHRYVARLQEVGRAIREGRLVEAAVDVQEVSVWAARHERVTALLATAYQRQQIHHLLGSGAQMDEAGLAVQLGFTGAIPAGAVGTALILLQTGRLDEARKVHGELRLAELRDAPRNWWFLPIVQAMADVSEAFRDRDLASLALELGLPFSDQIVTGTGTALVTMVGSVADLLGTACLVLERAEDAIRWFSRAVDRNQAARGRPFTANSLSLLGRALIDRGDAADADRARGVLDRALAEFEAIGMGGRLVESARMHRARL